MRVLHVVYAMNTGGIESWLMTLYRSIDKTKLSFDFLVNVKTDAFFDEEIKALGGRVIYGGKLNNPAEVFLKTRALLEETHYEAVHCHNVENAFPVLLAAKGHGLNKRLYHCHNNINHKWKHISELKKLYLNVCNKLSIHFSTHRLSVSKESGDILFGSHDYQQLSLGIELQNFTMSKRGTLNRIDFGINQGTLVVGHVGRFDLQKNHTFFIQIAAKLVKTVPDIKFVLVGTGKLETEILQQIKVLRLEKYFILLGTRSDVPQLMLDIMDVFLFPSLFEGLGLVVVEAQAAGLPVVCSNMIPSEAIVNSKLVEVCDINSSEESWVNSVLKLTSKENKQKEEAKNVVSRSDFNLQRTLLTLESLWLAKK